jgi:hypothetical protein
MNRSADCALALAELFKDNDGVLDAASVLRFMTREELRWRITSGRWQRPCSGVVVAQSGPLTSDQTSRIALHWAGAGSALAGLTAARLDRFKWYNDRLPKSGGPVYLLVPSHRKLRADRAGLSLVVHYSTRMGPEDIHPVLEPRRSRIARSLVDAAVWAPNERLALGMLAAGVQQNRVRIEDLRAVVERSLKLYRRNLIIEGLADIGGGAQALSELDFTRKVVRAYHLPEPERQSARRDSRGRRRYLDVVWDRWKIAVEIDGTQHTEDPLQRWEDMARDIDLQIDGYRVLRFPAWVVRTKPDYVARTTLEALHRSGYQK